MKVATRNLEAKIDSLRARILRKIDTLAVEAYQMPRDSAGFKATIAEIIRLHVEAEEIATFIID